MRYEYTDKIYKKYALLIVRAFNSLNRELIGLDFDELNAGEGYKAVSEKVNKTYKKCYDELIDILILFSLHYFEDSCENVTSKNGDKIKYFVGKRDGFRKEKTFDARKFVEKYLEKVNPIVKYIFNNEYERKISRAVESILTSSNKAEIKKQVDIAMKYWNRQAKQAGDNISMAAYIEGFNSSGIEYVKWETQEDERVCPTCSKRDGKIYRIDKIIIPLHYNCRCNIVPYIKKTE
ncbi:MAG: minor capsid protein [Clostridiales bacterium]|nr:minor capsid protein [Clostridiales bacterium]